MEVDCRNKNDQTGLTDPGTSDEKPEALSDSTEVINMRLVNNTILTSTPRSVHSRVLNDPIHMFTLSGPYEMKRYCVWSLISLCFEDNQTLLSFPVYFH